MMDEFYHFPMTSPYSREKLHVLLSVDAAKSDIKRWSNAKGEGTLFSIDLLDEQGGEIRCTFFKEACERFHPMLEQGKVYTFSGGRLKVAQRQFSSIRNEYEITFDANSEIVPVEDDHSIQSAVYAFRKIADIEQVGVYTHTHTHTH